MNIKIPVPKGCRSYSVPLVDIVRVENCSLTFFNTSAHNLYIIEKARKGEESFSLYSYRHKKDMLFALQTITDLLKKKSVKSVVLELEPMKS
ncbi:hypothetical protein H8S95_15525 [Pontibacter sp. KCTC 32443]|uniref:hypothetical protein n=1 Tax=Pontibacter TaxID=323449 RepID=UPI00164D8CB2|nr:MULTISPECIES: hypothetical protein [Pontibacter]MBC5775487.1 hypothetical protein [Pontibacter sp. KCTC 32443]